MFNGVYNIFIDIVTANAPLTSLTLLLDIFLTIHLIKMLGSLKQRGVLRRNCRLAAHLTSRHRSPGQG